MKTAAKPRPTAPIADPIRLPQAYTVPAWARPNTAGDRLEDAVFCAAIALKSLDDLLRTDPVWLGCWRARQALVCAKATCQWLRLKTDETALRDAVLLCGPESDPGPAGRVLLHYQHLIKRKPVLSSPVIRDLNTALGRSCAQDSAAMVDAFEGAVQTHQPPLAAAAALITALTRLNPDIEIIAWVLADAVIAAKLGWSAPVPLLLSIRFHPVLRLRQGRGRMTPDDPDFARALYLAFVEATNTAFLSANAIARRAEMLRTVAPKLRSKGADGIIQTLLDTDALLATAPGSGLSRWVVTRLLTRLEAFGAVRELSGRSSFKIYGL